MNFGRFTFLISLLFSSSIFAGNTAKSIVHLYNNAQSMTVKKSNILNLEKTLVSSEFNSYSHWLRAIKSINSETKPTEILKLCATKLEDKLLEKNKRVYCHKKLIYILSKTKSINTKALKSLNTEFTRLSFKELKHIKKMAQRSSTTKTWVTSAIFNEYLTSNKRPKRYVQKLFPSKAIRGLATTNSHAQKQFTSNYRKLKSSIKFCLKQDSNSKCAKKIVKEYKSHKPRIGTKSLFIFAKDLTQKQSFKESLFVVSTLLENQPRNEDYLFAYLWNHIEQKNFKDAYRFLSRHQSLHKNHEKIESSKLRFWIAMTLKNVNDARYAKVLESIVTESTISFYSIMASKVLNENIKSKLDILALNSKIKYSSKPQLKQIIDLHKRIIAFEKIKAFKFFNNEITSIYRLKNLNVIDDAIYSTSLLLSDRGHYLDSFKLLHWGMNNSHIQPNSQILDILFPRPYKSKISKASSTIDPFLPLSLIRQESGFNARAKSRVGARGLMQLMYPTAKSLSKRLRKVDLYNPNINIKLGTKYLKRLLKKYDKNLVYALAAYNAGEHRVKKWKGSLFNGSSILHNIERIPYKETRKYVKLIFRNLFFYKGLYQYQNKDDSKNINEIFDVKLGFNN